MPEDTNKSIRIPVAGDDAFDRIVGTIVIDRNRGITALVGIPKGGGGSKVKTYIFDKAKGWTMDKAKAWVKTHEHEISVVVDRHLGQEFAKLWSQDDDRALTWIEEAEETLSTMAAVELSDLSERPWAEVDQAKLPDACFLEPDRTIPVYEGDGEIGADGKHAMRGDINLEALEFARKAIKETPTRVVTVARLFMLRNRAGLGTYEHDGDQGTEHTTLEAIELDLGSATVTDNGDGTVKIGGLRIANLGKHTDRHGRVWDATSDVFKAIRETFAPLIERGWRVPLVWSHDLDPRDGENPLSHIALGWLQNLSQAGEWMVGELDKVPMGIYKMMRSGAWASVSPRILKGLRLGDYTAPWAIGHLSLCGARKAAMPKIRTFDELAGIYQADERPRDVQVAWECDLTFDIGTGDEAGQRNPPIDREDGTMDRAEALKALGLDEDTLKAQEAAVAELEAAKKEGKKHEENATEARKELDEFRGETRATDALEFSTGYESKLSVPNRSRVRVIHEALARFEGDLEFEEGEGKEAKTVAMTPLTAFVELASEILEAAADVVDLDEHGKKKVAVPGSAKGKGDAPEPGSDKDQDLESGALGEEVVDGNELDRQAKTRAAEIIEAAHKQGDVVEFDVAYEDALEEILQRKGSEG
jgi:hypothetical protein